MKPRRLVMMMKTFLLVLLIGLLFKPVSQSAFGQAIRHVEGKDQSGSSLKKDVLNHKRYTSSNPANVKQAENDVQTDVKLKENFKVIPGGQSIGVKLNSIGVIVVGYHFVEAKEGKLSPGELADIQLGDIITQVNGKAIQKMSDMVPVVKEAGEKDQALILTIQRDGHVIEKTIKPLQDTKDHLYRIGLYIRDSAVGVGTLTFVHPETKKYGALGHVISDIDTKKPVIVDNGQLMLSTVTSIERGQNGHPGEKLAHFTPGERFIGNIEKNSSFGIFGKLHHSVNNQSMNKPMPIALSNEIKEGPAKILTVVHGNKVESFDVNIVSVIPQKFPATKGMVIKITDPRLLQLSGGIVQGMSGSPILQNEKVVGAVTHVFVNDPTSGYGVHIEWMLHEAGIDIYQKGEERKAS